MIPQPTLLKHPPRRQAHPPHESQIEQSPRHRPQSRNPLEQLHVEQHREQLLRDQLLLRPTRNPFTRHLQLPQPVSLHLERPRSSRDQHRHHERPIPGLIERISVTMPHPHDRPYRKSQQKRNVHECRHKPTRPGECPLHRRRCVRLPTSLLRQRIAFLQRPPSIAHRVVAKRKIIGRHIERQPITPLNARQNPPVRNHPFQQPRPRHRDLLEQLPQPAMRRRHFPSADRAQLLMLIIGKRRSCMVYRATHNHLRNRARMPKPDLQLTRKSCVPQSAIPIPKIFSNCRCEWHAVAANFS
jgi:hypothetical protein